MLDKKKLLNKLQKSRTNIANLKATHSPEVYNAMREIATKVIDEIVIQIQSGVFDVDSPTKLIDDYYEVISTFEDGDRVFVKFSDREDIEIACIISKEPFCPMALVYDLDIPSEIKCTLTKDKFQKDRPGFHIKYIRHR